MYQSTTRRGVSICILAVAVLWFAAGGALAWNGGRGEDVARQWKVCQYLLAGRNPYAIAEAVLEANDHATGTGARTVFDIPRTVPAELAGELLEDYGPPEATYPPSAAGLFTIMFGWLPTPQVVVAVWLLVNAVALSLVAFLLAKLLPMPPKRISRWLPDVVVVGVLIMLFSPFHTTIASSQFSLVVLACVLYGCRRESDDIAAGLAWAVALVKPTVAIPFLIIPVLRRRWRTMAVTATVQAGVYAAASFAAHASPIALTRQWLAVSRHFLGGMYSVQEIINMAGLTRIETPISLLVLGVAVLVVLLASRSTEESRFAYLGVVSCVWIYHGPYDFVCVLPALMVLTGWTTGDGNRSAVRKDGLGRLIRTAAMASFVLLSLALFEPIYRGDGLATHVIRWGGRLAMLQVLVGMGYVLVFEHRHAIGSSAGARNSWFVA